MDFHGWMVGLATGVPFSGLCTRPGKGRGHGAGRDDSAGRSALQRAWRILARALAAVPPATTVPVTARCNGSGKGRGQGPTRDHSFGVWAFATGLAKGQATGRLGLAAPVAVLCSGPGKGLGRGVTRDCSSGFRPPCVSLQWLSFSAQGPEHSSYDVAAPCHVRSIASVAHESSH